MATAFVTVSVILLFLNHMFVLRFINIKDFKYYHFYTIIVYIQILNIDVNTQ